MFAMNLFVKDGCALSEILRFILNEKGVEFRVIDVSTPSGQAVNKQLFNNSLQAPALADHEVRLTDLDHMIEYIEERYPHPTMMPAGPAERATTRMLLRRLLRDFYPLLDKYTSEECGESLAQLGAELNSLGPAFAVKPFFISDDFGVMDAAFTPLLKRIRPHVKLSAEISNYTNRMLDRPAYQKALER